MMRLIDWHLRILKFDAADSEVILQKKWGASIVAIRIVCFVGFYDLADEDKMVREVFEKNEMHIVRCSAHTLHIGRFYSNGLLISPPSLNARWEF